MNSEEILTGLGSSTSVVFQLPDNPEQRYRGVFLGIVPGDYLLLHVEDPPPPIERQKVVVRLIQEGRAIGFQSVIEHRVEVPVTLMFLSKPDNIEVVSLRKTERMDVFVPVDVRHTSEEKGNQDTRIFQGYMTNISSGGCRVLTKYPIVAESVTHLSFNLPLEKHLYTLSGKVLSGANTKSSQKTVFGHRIRFFPSEKNSQDMGEIRRWINQNADFADLFQ